ncbi:MAG: sulfatase [Actinomycetota bacterium]|nr:sulfatase [Actinomycetota bacterium]
MHRGPALLLCLSLLGACSSTATPEQQVPEVAQRPNVLIFVTDDHRATGTMRQAMPDTLRLFGQEGTRFTQAFATTPLCCPSRASIFSGRYAHTHGVRTNDLAEKLDHDNTMQAHLQQSGYRTAITGKYLNRWPEEVDPPHFDDWAIMLQGYYYDALFNVDGTRKNIDGYTNDFVTKSSVDFLERFESTDEQPWFLYVGATPAHAPYKAEGKYEGTDTPPYRRSPAVKEQNLSDKPDFGPSKRSNFLKVRRKQLRTLYSADDLVQRVMSKVQALGEDEDTIAFFVGDNGQMWGEHGLTAKRYPYIPSIQIPFFVRWPGHVGAGARDQRLVANIDIAPTVLEVANAAATNPPDGRSLFAEQPRDRLLLEHWADDESEVPDWAALLTDTYEYVEYYRDSGKLRTTEYYDLVQDPWQLRNLLGDANEANDPPTRRLSRQLNELKSCAGESCP